MKTNHQRGFIARYSDQWWYKSRLTAKPDKRCDVVNYHEQLAALDCRPVRVARVKVRRRAEAMHEWRGHHYTPSDPVFNPLARSATHRNGATSIKNSTFFSSNLALLGKP